MFKSFEFNLILFVEIIKNINYHKLIIYFLKGIIIQINILIKMKNFLFSSTFMYLSVLIVIGINVFVCPDLLSHPDMKLNDLSYLTYDSKFVKDLNYKVNSIDKEEVKVDESDKIITQPSSIETKNVEENKTEEIKPELSPKNDIIESDSKSEKKIESTTEIKDEIKKEETENKSETLQDKVENKEIKSSDEVVNDKIETKEDKEVVTVSVIPVKEENIKTEELKNEEIEISNKNKKIQYDNHLKEAIENTSYFSGCKF